MDDHQELSPHRRQEADLVARILQVRLGFPIRRSGDGDRDRGVQGSELRSIEWPFIAAAGEQTQEFGRQSRRKRCCVAVHLGVHLIQVSPYFVKVDLPIELLCQTGETIAGKIMNVSESGLALTAFGPASVEGVVTVRFGLPSVNPQIFQAKADVVWNDAFAMGLRFLQIDTGCRSSFGAWLDSPEAQEQFQGGQLRPA